MSACKRKKGVSAAERKGLSEVSDADKKVLANLVEGHPCLWSLSDPYHKLPDAVSSAWESVGAELKKSGK